MMKKNLHAIEEEDLNQVVGGVMAGITNNEMNKITGAAEGFADGKYLGQQNTYFGKEENILGKANFKRGKTPSGSVDPILSPSSKQGGKTAK